MKTIQIRRTVVAEILDRVRQDLAARVPHEEIEQRLAGPNGTGAYNHYDWPAIEPLKVCEHANEAYMDNCLTCAPRWGFTGPKVVCK